MTIKLLSQHKKEVLAVLKKHLPKGQCWVIGSRADGNPKKYSDLDLVLKRNQKISLSDLVKLEEDFAESDIPFKVDVIDWHRAGKEIRDAISENHRLL